FWNTASVKRSGDVTRLQALVDKKKIVIFEVVIREILQLEDAEGVVCLPNEEIFAGLAQMGYEKPSTKLTFYKAFFSSQWKFLIHTILQSLSAKRTFWNDFSTATASAVICLSKGQKFNFLKYIFDSLVRNVDSSSKFYMYPRFIQLIIQNQVGDLSTHTTRFISPALTQKVFANMRRVGKGFSGVETPLFKGMLADRQPTEEELVAKQVQVDDAVAAAVEENVAEDVAHDTIPSLPSHNILSPSQRPSSPPQQPQSSPQAPPEVKKLEKAHKVKSSKLRRLRKVGPSKQVESSDDIEDVFNQGRIIDDMDKDEGIEMVKDAEVAESEGRHATEQAEKQAEIYHIDLDHSSKVLISAASATIPAAVPTVVAAYTRRKKGVIIRDPEEELSLKTPVETPKVKDKGKGIMVKTPKPMKKKDQIELDAEYVRKLHKEINRDEFNKDIDWDAAMDHVNQKSNNPQYIKRYQGMKKRPQTESEACKNMMIYLKNTAGYKMDFFKGMTYAQILDDEDDDVFIEATLLARKVPVVDYQIVLVDNKPRFKIIKADETHQFYIRFTTLLKNFDREDLESLWRIAKDIFYTSKPTNFSNEYMLLTLKTMFEKPDEQDAIWRNQKSVHGLALISTFKVHTGTIGECDKTSSRRRKWDVIGATHVYKTAASGISTRMMVEHILHKPKDQE
nr:hypothetical protein [Tanacetum cinerariifolium]